MTAARLREAATLMRERAEAAGSEDHVGESWVAAPMIDPANNGWRVAYRPEVDGFDDLLVETPYDYEGSLATHLSGWHPAVALAVADWLDRTADDFDQWHGVRSACRELDANDGETPEGFRCDCSFKDCYEHGKWHNCVHGMPNTDAALAVADVYMRSAS